MLSLILEQTLLEFLQTPNKIVGIVLAMLGLALSILAKKITKVVRKVDKVSEKDPIYYCLLGFALCLILVGLILTIFN